MHNFPKLTDCTKSIDAPAVNAFFLLELAAEDEVESGLELVEVQLLVAGMLAAGVATEEELIENEHLAVDMLGMKAVTVVAVAETAMCRAAAKEPPNSAAVGMSWDLQDTVHFLADTAVERQFVEKCT